MGWNNNTVSWWRFIFLVLMMTTCTCDAIDGGGTVVDERRNYITWDDMKVNDDEHKIKMMILRKNKQSLDFIGNGTNSYYNKRDNNMSRVIVVDKNGSGDSLTVQGAIDMVPDFNSHRIKIYVLPGIYRCVKQHNPKIYY